MGIAETIFWILFSFNDFNNCDYSTKSYYNFGKSFEKEIAKENSLWSISTSLENIENTSL